MNALIQTQFDSVETALTTLIDSITSYNPSIPAAQDLLSADEALTRNLDQLVTHQRNHQRILSLHATISTLDAQITSTLTTLTSLRAEILAAPATVLPPQGHSQNRREVPYIELLNYASNISKNTIPPTFRPRKPKTFPERDSDVAIVVQPVDSRQVDRQQFATQTSLDTVPAIAQQQQQQQQQSQTLTNGSVASTATATPSFTQSSSLLTSQITSTSVPTSADSQPQPPNQAPLPAPALVPATPTPSTSNPGIAALSAQEQAWLHPLAQIPFIPWPSIDVIGRSALAQVQGMVERGEGPTVFQRDEVEGGAKREGEEEEKMEGVDGAEGMEMGNGGGGGGQQGSVMRERRRVEEKPTMFAGGLDLYDPDEE